MSVSWSEPKVFDVSRVMLYSRSASAGDEFPVGSTEVAYDFVDDFGNHAFCNFTVNVLFGESQLISFSIKGGYYDHFWIHR